MTGREEDSRFHTYRGRRRELCGGLGGALRGTEGSALGAVRSAEAAAGGGMREARWMGSETRPETWARQPGFAVWAVAYLIVKRD